MTTSDQGAGGSVTDFAALAKDIERLANQYFSGVPGPVVNAPGAAAGPPAPLAVDAPGLAGAPRVGPSALNGGGGGASSAATLPPVPGPMHRPPIAAAPPPKESDLRVIPTLLSEHLGVSSPIAVASGQEAAMPAPYFLDVAGLPGAPPDAAVTTGRSLPGSLDMFSSLPVNAGDFVRVPALPDAAAAPALPAAAAPGDVPAIAGTPAVPQNAAVVAPSAALPAPGLAYERAPSPPATRAPAAPTATGLPSSPSPSTPSAPARPEEAAASAPFPGTPDALPAPPGPPGAPGLAYDFSPEIVPGEARATGLFDPYAVKRDFPILQERVNGRPLVWLDNAATTQKPSSVIDRISYFYRHENSNIHRAAHTLAARATDAYEGARDKVRRLLNAPSPKQIIFVRGATEGINLVAKSWGRRNVGPGDEIVLTWLEHHANIVPWQQLCSETGARLRVAPVDDRGDVILEEYERLLGPRTRIVSITQVSNALGTITPAREMVQMAHRHGARVLVDGAQAVSHMPVDVQLLDCDFYVFSGHKVFAPTGIGALFGKADVLDAMPPWQGGGNMISDVTFEKTVYQAAPWKFEAGTGSIADAVGLGAAIDYVTALGLENISRYEHELLVYANKELARVPGLRMIGTAREKAGVLSFVLDGLRTEDIGGALDQEGIAVRSGHHCAQPILRRFGLEATVRASLAPYNTCEDIDALVAALLRLQSGRPPRGI